MNTFARSKGLLGLARRFCTQLKTVESEISKQPVYLRPYDALKYEKPSTKLKVEFGLPDLDWLRLPHSRTVP